MLCNMLFFITNGYDMSNLSGRSQFTFTMLGGWVVKKLENFVYSIKIVNKGRWVVKNCKRKL